MKLTLEGKNQEGGIQHWRFTGKAVIASGPQRGGWSCLWSRKELLELYGMPANYTVRQVAQFMRREWKLKVTIAE